MQEIYFQTFSQWRAHTVSIAVLFFCCCHLPFCCCCCCQLVCVSVCSFVCFFFQFALAMDVFRLKKKKNVEKRNGKTKTHFIRSTKDTHTHTYHRKQCETLSQNFVESHSAQIFSCDNQTGSFIVLLTFQNLTSCFHVPAFV